MAWGGAVETCSDKNHEEACHRLRWQDIQATVLVSILKNPGGKYAKVKNLPIVARRRSTWIYVPAVINTSGWRRLATALEELGNNMRVEMQGGLDQPRTYVEVVVERKAAREGG